jgi:hypothetical protein
LDHYELVESPYDGKNRAYFAFMNMVHDATQVAGDAWVAIGDSAMFTNPLFSNGLNYGTGTAYMAALDTAAALNSSDYSREAFAKYEEYTRVIFRQLITENDMYYRAFKHEESFERAIMLKIFFAISDVLPRDAYNETDAYVFDLLNPVWVEMVNTVAEIQRQGEANGISPAEIARHVHEVADPFINEILSRPEIKDLRIGRYLSFYDDDGQRSDQPRQDKERGDYHGVQCQRCELIFDDSLARCPYCGQPSHLHQHEHAAM